MYFSGQFFLSTSEYSVYTLCNAGLEQETQITVDELLDDEQLQAENSYVQVSEVTEKMMMSDQCFLKWRSCAELLQRNNAAKHTKHSSQLDNEN